METDSASVRADLESNAGLSLVTAGSDDSDEQPVLAGALQRWGEKHKNKVQTLTTSDISCLHKVEVDGAPLVPDDSIKKRLRPMPSPQNKKMGFGRREAKSTSSNRPNGEVVTVLAGEALDETSQTTVNVESKEKAREKRFMGGLLRLNIGRKVSSMAGVFTGRKASAEQLQLTPVGTLRPKDGPFEGAITRDMVKEVRCSLASDTPCHVSSSTFLSLSFLPLMPK